MHNGELWLWNAIAFDKNQNRPSCPCQPSKCKQKERDTNTTLRNLIIPTHSEVLLGYVCTAGSLTSS